MPDEIQEGMSTAGISAVQQKNVQNQYIEKKRIAVARKAGTTQGRRGIEPEGPHIDSEFFKENYNKALEERFQLPPEERKKFLKKAQENLFKILQ